MYEKQNKWKDLRLYLVKFSLYFIDLPYHLPDNQTSLFVIT